MSNMSAQDALWLTMDRPNNLMVIDGVTILDGTPHWEAVERVVQERLIARFPVFRRRPERRGSASWAWVDDDDFDVSQHVRRVRLRKKHRGMDALQELIAEQRAKPLPKTRPLWRVTLVDGLLLPDGTEGSAVVTRFHHAIADGVRLTQLMLSMFDSADHQVAAAVTRRRLVGTSHEVGLRHVTSQIAGAVGSAVASPMSTVLSWLQPDALSSGAAFVTHPDRWIDAISSLAEEAGAPDMATRPLNDAAAAMKVLLTGSGDETVWTGEPGAQKAVAWSTPIDFADIKAVRTTTGTTVNDVLLAAVAGGLRRYLHHRGGRLREVVWMVPVNLQPFEDNLPPELGNHFALVMLPMPLGIAEPRRRLEEMHRRMERIKRSDEALLTFGVQQGVSLSPQRISVALTNFFANKAVGVLTNVPGPRSPMEFAGRPVRQVIGFAPCSGRQPMTATIFSYAGTVTVGFATDAGLIPDPGLLADLVVDEVALMRRSLA